MTGFKSEGVRTQTNPISSLMRNRGQMIFNKPRKKATVSGNPSLISQQSKQSKPITLAEVSILKGK